MQKKGLVRPYKAVQSVKVRKGKERKPKVIKGKHLLQPQAFQAGLSQKEKPVPVSIYPGDIC